MRGAATVLLVAAALVWGSQAVRKAERQSGNDLVGYLEASRALYAGGDPYHLPGRFPYIYPLFLATVIRPLASLPRPAASVIWFAIQAVCLCYLLGTAAAGPREGAGEAWRRTPVPILTAIVVAVFGDVLQNEFLNGQVNLIVLALAAAAIHVGRRHPRLAGPLLGAAIASKLTPALFLLYWLVERRYRIVVESVSWAVVFILSPWLIVRDRVWPMYDSYVREFVLARTASIDIRAEAIFFTPYGFWEWLTGSVPGRSAILLLSALVAWALIAWHTRVRRQSIDTSTATGWMYAAVTPLLTPMSEVHHLTMLIPAGMVSAGRVRYSRSVAATSAAFVVLIWIARFDRPGPWYFLSILCLVASAAIALRPTNQSGRGPLESAASDASAGGGSPWGSTPNASPSSRLPRVTGASEASAGRRWGWGPTAN